MNTDSAIEHYYTRQPKSKPQLGFVRVHLRGRPFEFKTSSSVFSKRRVDGGTRLLIESMVLPREGCVLDLGCGYGPVGIVAASSTPTLRVIMVDVNLRAVQLAKENAKRNGAENAEVRHGSLYEPVEDMQFAAVLCNPPISAGLQTVRSLVTGAPRHIESEGSLQMVVRSSKGGKRLTDLLKETFGNVTVLARASGYRVILSEKS